LPYSIEDGECQEESGFLAKTLNTYMNKHYVYQLVDPRTNKPFYIGEGKEQRAWSHLAFKSGCVNPHKDRIIKKYKHWD
jgi:hypothetical protein